MLRKLQTGACSPLPRMRDPLTRRVQIVYCSQACQTADWQRHKAECKTKSHKEQQLRSQDMLELLVSTRTRMMAGASFKDAVGTTLQGLDIPLAFDLKDLDKLI